MSEPLVPALYDPGTVRWGEDNPIETAPALSEEEAHTLRERMAAMDKLLGDQGKAKWKIEVFFFHKRKLFSHSAGAISFWESGTMFHGGGDAKAYVCPGKELKLNDCESIIPGTSNGYGFLACPRCLRVWQAEQVYGEIFGRWNNQIWSEKILQFFRRLDHNADIYLKYPKEDLRVASRLEQERELRGAKLERVRQGRVQYIYPLKNIIKDTANGADLLGRIHAFLTA
jgi:hypothetical protein